MTEFLKAEGAWQQLRKNELDYPFENEQRFEERFPADFIAEGLDQTRGWFYTLLVLATAVRDEAPFQNCVVTGMILAEDGRKMSKSLKNYPDPSLVIDQFGVHEVMASLFVSLEMIAYVIFAVIWGATSDRTNKRRPNRA